MCAVQVEERPLAAFMPFALNAIDTKHQENQTKGFFFSESGIRFSNLQISPQTIFRKTILI
jgi:hypothetical protein